LDNSLGPESAEAARVWVGAAVFVEQERSGEWYLLGVLVIRSAEEGWELEARGLEEIEKKKKDLLARETKTKERWKHSLGQTERRLREEPLRRIFLEMEPAESSVDALAETLCLETPPEELVQRLGEICHRLWNEGRKAEAERVFQVLLEALPASLGCHWGLERPESSAKEVRVALLSRLLVEFVLAGSEGASAVFHSELDPLDRVRSLYEVSRCGGELGPDIDGAEEARGLAEEVVRLLAFETESDTRLGRWLARLATIRFTPSQPRLIDPEIFEQIQQVDPVRKRSWQEDMLDLINGGLSERTFEGRRYLYLIADPEDDRLEGIRRLLPQLKIVSLTGKKDQVLGNSGILRGLKALFRRRLIA
jgi:hypothetical protein